MSSCIQPLAGLLSTDMNHYAGDPHLLQSTRYMDRISAFLQSDRSDQLCVRVAMHAQLRDAFSNADVQKRLQPYLAPEEDMQVYVQDAKLRAKFFSQKQQMLQAAILESEEQANLKAAHGELAEWEKENAVLLRHQMFMTYKPSHALLLESAATVALYRLHACLEEGEYTAESSDGEVPNMLRKMGGKTYFTQSESGLEVDEHNKMFNQQVLQNKRVQYEEKREKVAHLRQILEECPTLKRLEDFIKVRNEIYVEYGIDRLASLCARKDKELSEPNEGGMDASVMGLPSTNEYVQSRRVAQYSLPKIVEACYKNYQNILSMDDWDAIMKKTNSDARQVIENLKPLKDRETFRYWFLSCICADCPQLGPNKIVGKSATLMEDYKKFWQPQKSSYVPSLNGANRTTFMNKVAERRGLPHLVILSPVTYTYRENNDPNSLKKGEVDVMVYDMTNEKVLLMITDSGNDRRPRGAFLNAQEERYRFAAVIRSAITYDNQFHDFKCSGTVAEYFFDPAEGPEENYYCIMAPTRVYQKVGMGVEVPIKAFRPFTACPPRYFLLGSNWGVSAGTPHNPYPVSFAHMELNEQAVILSNCVPRGFVQTKVMPNLLTRAEGLQKLEDEKARREKEEREMPQQSPRATRTPRVSSPRATLEASRDALPTEEMVGTAESEDPLSPVVAQDALHPVRDQLLKHANQWSQPIFMQARARNSDLRELPAVKDGVLRTPLNVFDDIMKAKHNVEVPASAPTSARRISLASSTTLNKAGSPNRSSKQGTANVTWF